MAAAALTRGFYSDNYEDVRSDEVIEWRVDAIVRAIVQLKFGHS
jgi:hypothetical protein